MDAEEHPITEGLRRAIRADGRTPFELAKLANISPQQLYRFMNGTRGLSPAILDKLALLVGVEVRKVGEVSPLNVRQDDMKPRREGEVGPPGGPRPHPLRPMLVLRPRPSKVEPPGSPVVRPSRKPGRMIGAPGTPARRHPDGTLWSLQDYSDASDREYARRVEAGLARREGHERRKRVQKLGEGVLAFYKGLARKDRPQFFRVLDALLGADRP